MSDPKISVLLPSFRPDGLRLPGECILRQDFKDFEFLVSTPESVKLPAQTDPRVRVLTDPPRRPGDFYGLNKAWNQLTQEARGELLVFTVDYVWFRPDTLRLFWQAYQNDPLGCVSSFGHHFRKEIHHKPQILWQMETRTAWMAQTTPDWDGASLKPEYWEMALASIPRAKLLEVGGFDEAYDVGAGASEKECALRLAAAGCHFYIDGAIEVRNLTHGKDGARGYGADWDEAYRRARRMFAAHAQEVKAGRRLVVHNQE